MLGSIPFGNTRAIAATASRISVRLSLGYAFENEVLILPFASVRHVEIAR